MQNNDTTQLQTNKNLVLAFYDAVFNKKDIAAAFAYVDEKHITHHPEIPGGNKQGSIDAIGFFIQQNPNLRVTIGRAIAEGDLVALHVLQQLNPNDRGTAIVDIFRVENGKIVEHWDVIQPVPEKSAHDNKMI